ncbi:MAG TPA: MFS transporter [Allosphingosinicella sp.]|jgi:Na+/melibiose symporter-like transporter|nr:MFS transporter [Allosphingosinicella sp.]
MLKRRILAAFSGPGLPIGAVGLPMIVYLPPYYAGALGMDLAIVGLVFFLVRAIDLPLDPLLGHWMDRTRGRLGRYRPWLIAGGLTLAAGVWLVFMAKPGLSGPAAFSFLMVLYLGYSLTAVAQLGWGSTLSDDYHDRSRIFSWWMAAQVLGMILVLLLPPLAGGGTPAGGIHAMGWFVIATSPLTVLLMAVAVPERDRVGERPNASLAEILGLARNPLLLRLVLLDILTSVAPGITGAMFLFYFEHRLGFDAREASLLLLIYFVAGFAAAPLWIALARRIGKHRALAAAALAYAVFQLALSLMPRSLGMAGAIPAMAIVGLPYIAAPSLLRAMMNDAADVDRLETGLDRNALLQALLTSTQKISYAMPVAIIYPILSLIGFQPRPGAANTESAIWGMTLLFVLAPVALMILAAWVASRWPLGPERHEEVQAALAARN